MPPKTRDTKLKLEEPWRKIIKVNYAKAEDVQKLLLEKKDEGKGFLSPQGSVKADKRTNTLIIQDVRNNLEEIEQLIKHPLTDIGVQRFLEDYKKIPKK